VSRSTDRLYQLLPSVYRMRDADLGEPLRALLAVINEQVNVIEDDIAELYDNWFIETCQDWVVPYIGDLIGFQPVHEAGQAGAVDSAEGRLLNKILIPRRELANTLGYRRRKGTLALLATLAEAVAGWPALPVEFYRRLAWAQHLDHLRPGRGGTLDIRHGAALDLLAGPFDRAAHTVDVRRVNSSRTRGRYNIPDVGVFVWRLRSYSVTRAQAARVEGEGPHLFMFSALGNDTPLFTNPHPQAGPPHRSDETTVPVPIPRRALEERIRSRSSEDGREMQATRASARFYGEGKSLAIYALWPHKNAPEPIPRDNVVPADLSGWHYRAGPKKVAVDPVLGRMVFPVGHAPRRVWVTYHYGFSADMGGGEYERTLSQPLAHTLLRVRRDSADPKVYKTINDALRAWRHGPRLGVEPSDEAGKAEWRGKKEALRAAVIEIEDSAVYREALDIALEAGESLQIRAANRTRPVLHLTDSADESAFVLRGKQGSRFRLDGLIVVGRSIYVMGPGRSGRERAEEGDLCDVTIRHSTLVPGWALECGCDPKRPNEPSLEIFNSSATIKIEQSIIGSIYVVADEVVRDPVEIRISDSIVDATSTERCAVGAPNLPLAFAHLIIQRSTVLGEVHTHAIGLAESSIFVGVVRVARRQLGCMRFCYVPAPESRTPRRYHCQPDLAVAAVDELEVHPPLTDEQKAKRKALARRRVRPRFNSMRYGTPSYCQLALDCPEEIARGAEDESEMGAFHNLFQPQRIANLRARLDEYTPAGMDAGILFAN
jgi:hypothetical protein